MPITKLRPSFSFTQDRLEQLKAIVPEAFTDGKINWEALKQALGEFLEDENSEAEHGSTELAEVFGLFWPGKREARRLATLPSKGTLVPAPGEGIDEDNTRNIFIEGENLEVLKLLQKSYAGRIKMIYIDPPYNTGNDFVYKDDFKEPLEEYLRRTGQTDKNGKLLTTNTKTGGRFHSNWLNMVYPRLRLAVNLLRDDGVIFVSIDDNEVHNLRLLMNEVFGEENFVANVVWQKRTSPDSRKNLAPAHDHILVYSKKIENQDNAVTLLPLGKSRAAEYKNPDNDPRGPWASVDLTGQTGHATPSQFYSVTTPSGNIYNPPEGRCWALAEDTFKRLVAENRIWFGKDGSSRPRLKKYLSESEGVTTWTWWTNKDVGHNQEATKSLNQILDAGDIFTNPKPIRLLQLILQLASRKDSLILDFFAGSCTTAQAVLELNREDGGNRRFIMVQLPEPTPEDSPACKAGYATIAEIGKERIRRVIAKMKKEANGNSKAKRETPEDLDKLGRVDLGFKVFKLARSNFKAWQDYDGESIQELETLFDQAETPLVKGWKEDDLLTEIMLQQGFPLDSKIARQSGFKSNKVQLIESEACSHRLFVCLDPKIKEDTIKHLELRTEDIFVCLDSAITDQAKMRLADICRLDII